MGDVMYVVVGIAGFIFGFAVCGSLFMIRDKSKKE